MCLWKSSQRQRCVCVCARDNCCVAEVRDKDYSIPLRWEFKILPWDSMALCNWNNNKICAIIFHEKTCLFFFFSLMAHMGLSKVFSSLRCVCMYTGKMALSDALLSGTPANASIHLSGCVHSGFSVLHECMGDRTKWEAQLSVDLIRLVITLQQLWKAY